MRTDLIEEHKIRNISGKDKKGNKINDKRAIFTFNLLLLGK